MNKEIIKKKIQIFFVVFQRYVLVPAQAIVAIATIFVIIKTNTITNTANLLQIYNTIQNRTDIVAEIERQYEENENNGISDEAKEKSLYKKRWAAVSALLNAYEFACDQYLTNKIDKKAFETFYFDLIESIRTDEDYACHFIPRDEKETYLAIDRVYREWHSK